MAPHDSNPAVQAVRLRIARLSASGAPVSGAGNGYISGGLIQLKDSAEIKTGDEIEVTLADGTDCVDFKTPDTMKRRNLELTICGVEDEAFELIEGALLIPVAGASIGHADPALGSIPNPNGISLETWSKMIVGGAQDPTFPWLHSLWPRTYGWTRAESTYLNGHLGWVFNGLAVENAGMRATGPYADWEGSATAASPTRVRAVVRTATPPPAAVTGYVSVPA